MKRIISLLLALAMLFVFVACGEDPVDDTPDVPDKVDTPDTPDTPDDGGSKPKIGMIWYGNTDPMGGTFYAWANHAAELLDVELVWSLGSYDTAAELADCENLINAGCEGIYFIPMDTAANLQLGNYCQENGVYWAISNRDIIDEEIRTICYNNPYFVTHIYDNSYQVCKDMVKVLADKGIKKVCMISGDPTDAMMVDRNAGFTDGCAEYGIEILGTFQSATDSAVIVDGVNNFLTLYPEMEAILAVSGTAGVGEAIISTLEGSGREKGSIKVAAFDTFAGNKEAFEAGWLAASCGGYTSECLVAFISLVNRVKGNVASEEVMTMSLAPLMITSSEDMDIFSQYVDNPEVQLYSDELILSLVGPNVTREDYQAVLDSWSIEYVKEAVGIE